MYPLWILETIGFNQRSRDTGEFPTENETKMHQTRNLVGKQSKT